MRAKDLIDRPFEVKFPETRAMTALNLGKYTKPAIGCSGGKDSVATLHIVLQFDPNIIVVYEDTGVAEPQTRQFIKWLAKEWDLNLIITKPEKTFWQCAKEYGLPNAAKGQSNKRTRDHCCYYLKEKPMMKVIKEMGIDCVFTGTTADESWIRAAVASKKGMCYYHVKWGVQKVHPIQWWTEQEVWNYIKTMKLPYSPVYDAGARRVGCMTCTAYKTWEADMQKLHPKLYKKIKLLKDKQYVMELKE